MSWTCPTCARTFAREDQFHSHDTVDLDGHFAGRPERLRDGIADSPIARGLLADLDMSDPNDRQGMSTIYVTRSLVVSSA
jgi:hypothetical protein